MLWLQKPVVSNSDFQCFLMFNIIAYFGKQPFGLQVNYLVTTIFFQSQNDLIPFTRV